MLAARARLAVARPAALRPPVALWRTTARLMASSSSNSSSTGSVAARRLRSPVTWFSATATLAGLYGLYEYQYRKQLRAQRSAGKPDLGGPFSLLDVDGKTVTNEDLRGQWTLLYFGFSKCPDICPEEMNKLTTVLEQLDAAGKPVQPVFITIDPHRDTAARLKSYFAEGGFHPRFRPLTGPHEAVKQACRSYRVYYSRPSEEEIKAGDYLIDHSIISYLLTPDGEFADYYGKSLSAAEMEAKVRELISEWESDRWWAETLPSWLQSSPPPSGRVEARQ